MLPCDDLHGKIIAYKDIYKSIPKREKFLNKTLYKKVTKELGGLQTILFMPNSLWDNKPLQAGQYQKSKYVLTLFGILEDGRHATVSINDIKVYFEIKIPDTIDRSKTSVYAENLYYEIMMEGEKDFQKYCQVTKTNKTMPSFGFKIEPTGYEVVKGKPLHLFQEHESSYARFYFNKLQHRKEAIEYIRALGHETCHDDLNSYYRVASRDYKLPLGQWLEISEYVIQTENQYIKDDVIQVSIDNIKQYKGDIVDHLFRDYTMSMSFDIETYNNNVIADDKFVESELTNLPLPENSDHNMFMISMSFQWYFEKSQILNVCLVDIPAAPHPDFLTIVCGSEENLLRAFAQIYDKLRPEFIMGFNDSNYDWKWVIERSMQTKGLLAEITELFDPIKQVDRTDKNSYYNYTSNTIKIEAETFATGKNLQVPNYIPFDVMILFRQLYPTSQVWGLNFFLKANKLETKEDMPYKEMFMIYYQSRKMFRKTGKVSDELLEKMALVGKYCVVDSNRCHDLITKRGIIKDKREIANQSFTSVHDAFYRANGMKVRNLVIAEGDDRNIKISNITNTTKKSGKYPGAWVFSPEKGLKISKLNIQERIEKAKMGFKEYDPWLKVTDDEIESYYEVIKEHGITPSEEIVNSLDAPKYFKDMLLEPTGRPVGGLDFSSLYPSLMMCYNLSPEYIVKDIKYAKELNKMVNEDGTKKHNLHKIKFEFGEETVRAWSVRHDNNLDPSKPGFKFGLFPYILQRLFNDRAKLKKAAKGLNYWEHVLEKMKLLPPEERYSPEGIAAFDDAEFNYNAIDSKQKALKVYMNTFYGESGNPLSPLFMLPVAGGITSAGRENIKKAYNKVVDEGCKVYYGDSVTPDTPILIRYTKGPLAGNIDIRTIDDIPGFNEEDDKWIDYLQFKPSETESIR
ncbi:MAG: DNA polymerase domain-containing protein, partial [Cetobacterium sp.]